MHDLSPVQQEPSRNILAGLLDCGPIIFCAGLVAAGIVVLLLLRRFLRTTPGLSLFTTTDIALILLLQLLAMGQSLSVISIGLLVRLYIRGVDTEIELENGLREVSFYSSALLLSVGLILLATAIQASIRFIRQKNSQQSADRSPGIAPPNVSLPSTRG